MGETSARSTGRVMSEPRSSSSELGDCSHTRSVSFAEPGLVGCFVVGVTCAEVSHSLFSDLTGVAFELWGDEGTLPFSVVRRVRSLGDSNDRWCDESGASLVFVCRLTFSLRGRMSLGTLVGLWSSLTASRRTKSWSSATPGSLVSLLLSSWKKELS